jgi:ferredoxin
VTKVTASSVFTATVSPTCDTFAAPASQTLLHSAELSDTPGFTMTSSCRNGTCRSCICQLLVGEVTYRIDWPGLSLDEKRAGLILPCVAYPKSDVVIELLA